MAVPRGLALQLLPGRRNGFPDGTPYLPLESGHPEVFLGERPSLFKVLQGRPFGALALQGEPPQEPLYAHLGSRDAYPRALGLFFADTLLD